MQEDCKIYLVYTFHKHSTSKNTVYFRCSDKKCSARIHFKTDTKKLLFKGEHISPIIHKSSRHKKGISVTQLQNQSELNIRSAVWVKKQTQYNLRREKEVSIPKKRTRKTNFLNSSIEVLLRWVGGDLIPVQNFGKKLMKKGKASHMYSMKGTELKVKQSCKTAMVEIQLNQNHLCGIIEKIQADLPFRNDFSVLSLNK